VRTVVLRKRLYGPAPAGPPVRCVAYSEPPSGTGVSLAADRMPGPPGARGGPCHEPACGRYPWLSGAFAPTQGEHKPEVRAKINTDVTRTKRHSPAYGGTRRTMTVTENSASLPAEMRVSWADYSFPGMVDKRRQTF
jgi:hypothetical protein